MLTALLLVLTSSATPAVAPESFLLRQEPAPQGEPDLRWNGETEDVYRRALHLWKVRGKPAEAADLLLGIADTAEVLQIAGQSSWVLVLAAQCLAEAGRGEEAAALIPGIERGVKGTVLEGYVVRELAAQAGLAANQDAGLDQAFLNSLVEVFQGSDGASIQGFVEQFRRALLPYLFEALDLWSSGNAPKNVGIFSFRYALSYLDQNSVPRLIQFTESLSDMAFLALVHDASNYADDEARLAAWKFWERLASSEDPVHADRGRRGLARLAKSHFDLVGELFDARLDAGDRELEAVWLSFIKGQRDPSYTETFRRAYTLGDEGRWMALEHFMSTGSAQDLLSLAVGGDEVAACLALALAVFSELGNSATYEVNGYPNGTHRVLDREVTDLTSRDWSISSRGSSARYDLSDSRWNHALGMLERQVQRVAPAGQLLLVLAATVMEDDAVLRQALENLSPEAQVVMVSVLYQGRLSHPFPYEVIWEWNPDGVQMSDRSSFESSFTMLLANYSATATLEQVKRRLGLLHARGRLQELAANWRKIGRDEDVLRLIADESIPTEAWLELLFAFGRQGSGCAPEILPILANRILRGESSIMTGNGRAKVEEYYAALIDRSATPLSHVSQEQLHALLEASLSTGSRNPLVNYVAQSEDAISVEARKSFCVDAIRARYLLSSVHESAPEDLVLASLRLGIPSKECFKRGVPSPNHFKVGSSARVELIRLLLRSSDLQDVKLGLLLTQPDLHAYQSLQAELAPLWKDPALAASVASYVGVHRDADPAIISLMLAAWQLPNLQERHDLVKALSNTVDRRVVPVLMEAISDANQKVAAAAREGLQRLREIEDQHAFWESWQATGIGGSPEAALLKQVRSTNREVRLAAIRALGATRAENALPLLISLLEDPDADVVAAARAALAWLAEPPPPGAPTKASESGGSGD